MISPPSGFAAALHALANIGDLAHLAERQPEFLREREHVERTGIAVELGRFRQAHAGAFANGIFRAQGAFCIRDPSVSNEAERVRSANSGLLTQPEN